MIDHGESTPPDAEPSQPAAPIMDADKIRDTAEPPSRGRSLQYGKTPVDEASSGRRARLRHPSRGAVRR